MAAENKAGIGPFSDPSSPVKIIESLGNTPLPAIFHRLLHVFYPEI